jgi:hypothetical protein
MQAVTLYWILKIADTYRMKGGSFNFVKRVVKDSDFKYTTDPERILWVKNVFPVGQLLINAIQSIPWNSYRYNGDITLWKQHYQTGTRLSDEFHGDVVFESVAGHIEATTQNELPFVFIGGSAYEVLNTAYKGPEFPSLHKYVDPTGDIDIELRLPEITNIEGVRDPPRFLYEDISGTIISPFVENYIDWVFNNLYNALKVFEKDFDYLFPTSVDFDYLENHEGQHAIDAKSIGRLWLLKIPLFERGMYKIQLNAKFNGMNDSDHMMEFILNVDNNLQTAAIIKPGPSFNAKEFLNTPLNLRVHSIPYLYMGNVEASKARIVGWNTHERHKFYNHIGRLQYLNLLTPALYFGNVQIHKDKLIAIAGWIKTIIITLATAKMNGTLCQYDYNYTELGTCDETELLKSIIGMARNLLFMKPISNGTIPIGGDTHHKLVKGGTTYRYTQLVDMLFPPTAAGGVRKRRTRRRSIQRRKTRKPRNWSK